MSFIYRDMAEQMMLLQGVKVCLLTACYQNPLGYSLSSAEKKQIAEMAQQHACPVIEDDVFGEFGYQKKRLLPIKAWDKAGMVIWCSSFSKTLASGYRIGWAVPGQYHWHMRQKLLARNLAVNTPLQLAMADFIYCGEYRKHLNKLHVNLSVQMDSLMASVEGHFSSCYSMTKPDGGYSLWIQLPDNIDATRLYQRAKEEGINVTPGEVFSSRALYRSCIRLNAGNPWSPRLEDAVSRLSQMVSDMAG